jgi:hypothetical protein
MLAVCVVYEFVGMYYECESLFFGVNVCVGMHCECK